MQTEPSTNSGWRNHIHCQTDESDKKQKQDRSGNPFSNPTSGTVKKEDDEAWQRISEPFNRQPVESPQEDPDYE
jgi:hypothetical protein